MIPIFKKAFRENKPMYSEVYFDRGNYWISGFAPFTDKNGRVVAVVELDMNLVDYQTRLDEFNSWANYFRIIGLIMSIIVGTAIGIFFGKPISDITKGMIMISNQDFTRNIEISKFKKLFPDETIRLTDTFYQMSDKLNKTLKELMIANKKLDELDHSKSIFLNFIAHEIRTPLTGLGFIDFLKQHNSCSEEDEEVIESINDSYLRIKSFAESAQKYIRALNYTIKDNAFCKLDEAIKFSLMEKKFLAEEQNIKFLYTIDDDNCIVQIEEEILVEILNILFDNAVKFSDTNSHIKINVAKDSEDLTISIKDNGIGIKTENLNNIFNPYFVDDIYSHSKGSGVNLPIAKVLINKYDGQIESRSEGKSKGSEFILKLKLYEHTCPTN